MKQMWGDPISRGRNPAYCVRADRNGHLPMWAEWRAPLSSRCRRGLLLNLVRGNGVSGDGGDGGDGGDQAG
jgi:hypothetical protein